MCGPTKKRKEGKAPGRVRKLANLRTRLGVRGLDETTTVSHRNSCNSRSIMLYYQQQGIVTTTAHCCSPETNAQKRQCSARQQRKKKVVSQTSRNTRDLLDTKDVQKRKEIDSRFDTTAVLYRDAQRLERENPMRGLLTPLGLKSSMWTRLGHPIPLDPPNAETQKELQRTRSGT